ncbi:hypothetical protein PT974_11320 [Cladobotryum mycophilum]|uniref:Up-regulated during septation protein 1 domain-containing protein n=1 Tax=Cladobotryum mycophilum TaxID=491253 RepID=A0ABR0S5D7_9HYPO
MPSTPRHPDIPRKYQLFPKPTQSPTFNCVSSVQLDRTFASASIENREPKEKNTQSMGFKLKISRHNLAWRRKVNVPELGPMTTVQEAAMDSPTIPEKELVRVRSSSAPEDVFTPNKPEPWSGLELLPKTVFKRSKPIDIKPKELVPKTPRPDCLSPAPSSNSSLSRYESNIPSRSVHLRSESTPSLWAGRTSRSEGSPRGHPLKPTISTPNLAGCATPRSINPLPTPLKTPVSAPALGSTFPSKSFDRPKQAWKDAPLAENSPYSTYGHRRFVSESSSFTEQSRPRKGASPHNNNIPQPDPDTRSLAMSSKQGFEKLPEGWRPCDIAKRMDSNAIAVIRNQAIGQAEMFEVLSFDDELRQLDERAEYLRCTCNSLRAGRRSLQSRICQYLRSPQESGFTRESIIKQEAALADLDASIDNWFGKLEKAENRRTRVRQKLLEHIAAAAILPMAGVSCNPSQSWPPNMQGITTPPRSPTTTSFFDCADKTSTSPPRMTAQVPSTIPELPLDEKMEENQAAVPSRQTTIKGPNTESIQIYPGEDLLALLTDVEDEIHRINGRTHRANQMNQQKPQISIRLQQINAQGYKNHLESTFTTPAPLSPPAPTPPLKDPPKTEELLLTSAVYKP